jgi:hypothetical protein
MEKLTLQGHKVGSLSFREIYDNMDRRAFVRRIATVTKRSETAVYNWISGKYKPDALAQTVIAQELGIPASELFPKEDKVCAQ